MTEKQKFLEHVKKLEEKGLISLSYTNYSSVVLDVSNKSGYSEEHIYAELNRMREAKKSPLSDPEVLGKYSL